MTKSSVEIGNQFGYLEVIALHNEHKRGNSWLCKCVCGEELVVQTNSLVSKNGKKTRKSCGCKAKFRNGKVAENLRLYSIWYSVKRRCYEQTCGSYEYYGGKGIGVCDIWKDNFEGFAEWSIANGYEKELTIDRIDTEKDYAPDNCRWVNTLTQAQNRGTHKDNKTGVNGSIKTPNGRFHVYITRNFKRYNLGMYDTISEAKNAREKAEIYYEEHGTLEGYEPQWKRLRKKKR